MLYCRNEVCQRLQILVIQLASFNRPGAIFSHRQYKRRGLDSPIKYA